MSQVCSPTEVVHSIFSNYVLFIKTSLFRPTVPRHGISGSRCVVFRESATSAWEPGLRRGGLLLRQKEKIQQFMTQVLGPSPFRCKVSMSQQFESKTQNKYAEEGQSMVVDFICGQSRNLKSMDIAPGSLWVHSGWLGQQGFDRLTDLNSHDPEST